MIDVIEAIISQEISKKRVHSDYYSYIIVKIVKSCFNSIDSDSLTSWTITILVFIYYNLKTFYADIDKEIYLQKGGNFFSENCQQVHRRSNAD